jgi:hypothetical protein
MDDRFPSDPTPAEIAARAAEIRKGWSESEHIKRCTLLAIHSAQGDYRAVRRAAQAAADAKRMIEAEISTR